MPMARRVRPAGSVAAGGFAQLRALESVFFEVPFSNFVVMNCGEGVLPVPVWRVACPDGAWPPGLIFSGSKGSRGRSPFGLVD